MATLPTTLPIMNSVVDQTKTKFLTTFERPMAPGVSEIADGMAMVSDWSDPIDEKAKPSMGTNDPQERFLGTAIVGVVNVRHLPLVEEIVAPTVAPANVVSFTLQRTPVINAPTEFRLYNSATNVEIGLVPAPAIGNDKYSINGSTVTVGSLLMGVQLRAVYIYEPTYNEVLNRFHQASINFDNVNQLLEQVSIGGGVSSEIFTNFWNSLNGQFVNGGLVCLGAHGRFSAGGGGTIVGRVIRAPTAEDTTLGFRVIIEN